MSSHENDRHNVRSTVITAIALVEATLALERMGADIRLTAEMLRNRRYRRLGAINALEEMSENSSLIVQQLTETIMTARQLIRLDMERLGLQTDEG